MGAAALGFLGLGVPPPHPEWGALLINAREYIRNYPYLLFFPSITLASVTLSFNILGDNLRDIFDEKIQDVVK
jgi:peptide/nickel transport system permease protein